MTWVSHPQVDWIAFVLGCFLRWPFELVFSKPIWPGLNSDSKLTKDSDGWFRNQCDKEYLHQTAWKLRGKLCRCFQAVWGSFSFPTSGSPHKDRKAMKNINPTDIDSTCFFFETRIMVFYGIFAKPFPHWLSRWPRPISRIRDFRHGFSKVMSSPDWSSVVPKLGNHS